MPLEVLPRYVAERLVELLLLSLEVGFEESAEALAETETCQKRPCKIVGVRKLPAKHGMRVFDSAIGDIFSRLDERMKVIEKIRSIFDTQNRRVQVEGTERLYA